MKYTFRKKKQSGFALLELIIAVAIFLALTIKYTPIGSYLMVKINISAVIEDLNRYAISTKTNGQTSEESQPYDGLDQASFAKDMYKSHLKTSTSSSVVLHTLGGGDGGTVTVSQTGTQFAYTLPKINSAACPEIITGMQSNAWKVTLNGSTVKATDDNDNVTTPYSVNRAKTFCTGGDTNEVVITYN